MEEVLKRLAKNQVCLLTFLKLKFLFFSCFSFFYYFWFGFGDDKCWICSCWSFLALEQLALSVRSRASIILMLNITSLRWNKRTHYSNRF